MQIESTSGGAEFSVSDLQLVVERFAVLVVCDGLDEVADIGARRRAVDEITKGIRRLESFCLSLQTIVTSRPTTFTNSPGFLGLLSCICTWGRSIDSRLGLRRKVGSSEGAERTGCTRSKSDARLAVGSGPLERSIEERDAAHDSLESYPHRKGTSLPDKRTALYDSYIGLFFDREAEKSDVVRERRDLLVDIHRYLGWILHSEAQTSRTGGRIDVERMRAVVRGYLSQRDMGQICWRRCSPEW